MATPLDATTWATRGPVLLEPQIRVTILEHAFRALRADPPGASQGELDAHRRLRIELLEAAAAQFVGRSNGLARANASGGHLLLTEECCAGGGWRITHFDAGMQPTHHEHYDAELEAIRALLLLAG